MADLDSVDLDADEWSGDINNVASVLKLWLRELPDPLMTHELHNGFLEAASTRFFFLKKCSQPDPAFFFHPQEMKTIDSDIFGSTKE